MKVRSGDIFEPIELPSGGHLGLPADTLVDTDGTVVDVKYGKHAADQWSVDELLQRG